MASEFESQKARLRGRWRETYPKVAATRKAASERLCAAVRKTEFFAKAKRIGLYAARETELDVLPLWDPARCGFPKILPDGRMEFYRVNDLSELLPGYGNIPEPSAVMLKWITDWRPGDFILVPGAVFDREGGRIGSGKGFYDRFLKTTSARPWGVGWEAQVSPEPVPVGANDVRMWALCTEEGWRRVEAID